MHAAYPFACDPNRTTGTGRASRCSPRARTSARSREHSGQDRSALYCP